MKTGESEDESLRGRKEMAGKLGVAASPFRKANNQLRFKVFKVFGKVQFAVALGRRE